MNHPACLYPASVKRAFCSAPILALALFAVGCDDDDYIGYAPALEGPAVIGNVEEEHVLPVETVSYGVLGDSYYQGRAPEPEDRIRVVRRRDHVRESVAAEQRELRRREFAAVDTRTQLFPQERPVNQQPLEWSETTAQAQSARRSPVAREVGYIAPSAEQQREDQRAQQLQREQERKMVALEQRREAARQKVEQQAARAKARAAAKKPAPAPTLASVPVYDEDGLHKAPKPQPSSAPTPALDASTSLENPPFPGADDNIPVGASSLGVSPVVTSPAVATQ